MVNTHLSEDKGVLLFTQTAIGLSTLSTPSLSNHSLQAGNFSIPTLFREGNPHFTFWVEYGGGSNNASEDTCLP
jgi:hypothetical protein